jgi:hypothetical protein
MMILLLWWLLRVMVMLVVLVGGRTIDLVERSLPGLLLLSLRPRSFGFPVAAIALLSESLLSLCGTFRVQRSRLAIGAVVNLWHPPTRIIAFDVLPSLTSLTEDRIAIIVLEGTDALDGVRLIIVQED